MHRLRVGAMHRRKTLSPYTATSVFSTTKTLYPGSSESPNSIASRAFMARAVSAVSVGFTSNAGNPTSSAVNQLLSSDGLLKPRVQGIHHRQSIGTQVDCIRFQCIGKPASLPGMTITLREIKRYPVKGLCGETLNAGADTRPIVTARSVIYFGAHIERFRQDEPRLDAEEPIPQPRATSRSHSCP